MEVKMARRFKNGMDKVLIKEREPVPQTRGPGRQLTCHLTITSTIFSTQYSLAQSILPTATCSAVNPPIAE